MTNNTQCIMTITKKQAQSAIDLIDLFRENFNIEDDSFSMTVSSLRRNFSKSLNFMKRSEG